MAGISVRIKGCHAVEVLAGEWKRRDCIEGRGEKAGYTILFISTSSKE